MISNRLRQRSNEHRRNVFIYTICIFILLAIFATFFAFGYLISTAEQRIMHLKAEEIRLERRIADLEWERDDLQKMVAKQEEQIRNKVEE